MQGIVLNVLYMSPYLKKSLICYKESTLIIPRLHMAQWDDLPKKKPGTESRLTMVPGSYAAACCSEGHPGGARGLPEYQPFSQFTLGH